MSKGTLVLVVFLFIYLLGCKKATHTAQDFKPYDGPVATFEKVRMYFSDSAIVKVKMQANVQDEYSNGDRLFPKGIILDFYDNDGTINSTLTADKAKYEKKTGIYTVMGNVVITGVKEYKKLNTEELYWNPATKKVYTDKFVRIETQTEILTGNGLDATQDFKNYKIRNPAGVFSVNEF